MIALISIVISGTILAIAGGIAVRIENKNKKLLEKGEASENRKAN